MSSKNKKVKHTKKEEQQGNRVIKIIFVALIILGFALMLGISFLG